MIDYVKLKLPNTYWPKLRSVLPEAHILKLIPGGGGEIAFETYKYKCFEIVKYRSHIELSGSIHKYYNMINSKGEQNHNDFSREDFCKALERLEIELGIPVAEFPLIQLEFGVNIRPDFIVKDFLQENVLAYDYKPHSVGKDKGHFGFIKEFETTQFWAKIYDKGSQYQLESQVLRVELKYKLSAYLRRLGIGSLNDLKNTSKWENLARDFFQRIEQDLLVVDSVEVSMLPNTRQREELILGMNPALWSQMKKEVTKVNGSNKPIHPTTIWRRKQRFNELLEVHDLTKLKAQVVGLIRNKILEISGVDVSVKRTVHKISPITRLE